MAANEANAPERITQINATVLESDLCLGNLWPTAVFETWFEYTPVKSSLVKISHNGRCVTGTVLEPSYGMQIGVIKLT